MMAARKIPVVVTTGEPAGIGPELLLRIWRDREALDIPPFMVVSDAGFLTRLAVQLGFDVPIRNCAPEEATTLFKTHLPVLSLSGKINASPGKPDPRDGKLVCESIETAVNMTLDGRAGSIVTAPINKKALYDSGFDFPGHTEYLAALAQTACNQSFHPVMMLAGPQLKTVPVTIHIALKDVPARLTSDLVVRTGKITAHDLQHRFGIANPRIAVAGLNPHAGEDGAMGDEDTRIVAPAIMDLKQAGINAFGPLPADTLFHARAREKYDAVLCMYHDQALIPAKTLAFDESVNVTLGLPFIRTSPDHGTAYDIAGKGIANPGSMVAALKLAAQMARLSEKDSKQAAVT